MILLLIYLFYFRNHLKLFYPNQENPIIRGLVAANKPLHLVIDDTGFGISPIMFNGSKRVPAPLSL